MTLHQPCCRDKAASAPQSSMPGQLGPSVGPQLDGTEFQERNLARECTSCGFNELDGSD